MQQLPSLTLQLHDLHRQVENLNVPLSTFAGIHITATDVELALFGQETVKISLEPEAKASLAELILNWLTTQATALHCKVVAAGISVSSQAPLDELRSRLWLEADIVPQVYADEHNPQVLASRVANDFDKDNVAAVYINQLNEVLVADDLLTFVDYETVTPLAQRELLQQEVDAFKGKKLVFFSATPRGGGVALMRHA
ncbi:MAG TPA: hypothetical protein VF209_01125, partial [Patescibacteria group bacterium]